MRTDLRQIEATAPVFIAGSDRSGTTLMFALLASHPDLCMVRRTNMWRYFYQRYGDLASPENFERCLDEMVRYRRMRHLQPDADRIRREFVEGDPSYGRLFCLFHRHHAERAGKSRWGDKSLHTEHFADDIFAEFPGSRGSSTSSATPATGMRRCDAATEATSPASGPRPVAGSDRRAPHAETSSTIPTATRSSATRTSREHPKRR